MSLLRTRTIVGSIVLAAAFSSSTASAAAFTSGNLIVSRSVYTGDASTVTVGQALPGGGTAVADGTYPGVFANDTPDPSFGVTSPIFLDQYSVTAASATLVNTLPVPTGVAVTSFSSKSELGMSLSTDGRYITFMAYVAGTNQLDVSNSNTPNHVDPTDPVTFSNQRTVVSVDYNGVVQGTKVNAYSGNNGRGAVFDATNKQFFLVGNAGNGTGTEPCNIVSDTGVQLLTPPWEGGPESIVVGAQQGTCGSSTGFEFGYSVTQYGFTADKSGKDDNFRGIALFNNTLYVTKGSGGNGINTVFQVGTAGTLPTTATASTTPITILPGFPTGLAKNAGAMNPFGIWFANATTLYVADEGDGTAANAATSTNAGLQKWVFESDNQWHRVYVLQNGLQLGTQYSVPGLPSSFNPATDGLRHVTGKVNGDGTVTLYATTSTISSSGDQGADPNELVAITDTLSFTSPTDAAAEQFTVLKTAAAGEVLRGVSFAPTVTSPVPVPKSWNALLALLLGACGFGFVAFRSRRDLAVRG